VYYGENGTSALDGVPKTRGLPLIGPQSSHHNISKSGSDDDHFPQIELKEIKGIDYELDRCELGHAEENYSDTLSYLLPHSMSLC
jgi:hypothetical protein